MREMLAHYQREVREELRLHSGWGALELARTQELLLRHLPKPPAAVLDVGGATGTYSEWLGGLGYETHLVDPVPRHVDEAMRACAHLASVQLGDARTLARRNGTFSCVLLMGPMYHLTEAEERVAALREAWRVLRPGGVLIATAISRFASLIAGLVRGSIDDPDFAGIVEQDLRDGQHRNSTGNPEYFTTAYFHDADEFAAEIAQAGFTISEVAAVEGPLWTAPDFDARWRDPARRAALLAAARAVEHEAALFGASPHLLAAAVKPDTTQPQRRDRA